MSADEARTLNLAALNVGRSRQDVIAHELASVHDMVVKAVADDADAMTISAMSATVDALLVASSDPSLHRLADISGLRHGTTVIHTMAKGPRAVVGPTVLGRGNACSECWQLRSAACASEFHFDGSDSPAEAPFLGPVLHASAAIADELAAIIEDPFLALYDDAVHTFDSTNRSSRRHALVRHPACSTCARYWAIQMPIARGTGDPDFSRIAETVVSPVCGIVMTVEPVDDIADGTAEPFVYWARLAATAAAHGSRVSPQAAGKGWTNDDASRSVLGESLERYCGLTWRATEIRRARLSELKVPYVPPQSLSSLDDLDLGTDDSAIEWCPSTSITTGDTIWVPSQAVSLRQDPGPHERRRSNATGLAAGRNLADATGRALLEIIERDSFLRCWAARQPAARYDATRSPDAHVRAFALRQASRGLRLDLYLMHHDEISAACLAVITASRIPIRAAGLGAAPTALDAMHKAAAEVVQVRRALSLRLDDPAVLSRARDLARSAAQAETMEDHGLLYAASESTGSFDFLENQPYTRWSDLEGPPAQYDGPADDVGEACEGLSNYIARRAPSPCFVDVTTPDVRTFELEVVRVIAPGLATPHWGPRSQALINARIGLHHLGNTDPHPLV
jgi:ribosomal protein S12 methylthiotransferase accessory factor